MRLLTGWGTANWVNPPFSKDDVASAAKAATAFVRKAIGEQKKGKTSVIGASGVRLRHYAAGSGCRGKARLGEYHSSTWTAGRAAPDPPNIACFICAPRSRDHLTQKDNPSLRSPMRSGYAIDDPAEEEVRSVSGGSLLASCTAEAN